MRTLCSLAVLVGSCVLAANAHATNHSCCSNSGVDVSVSIDDGVTSLGAGGSTTYTIVVTNDGHRTARWVDIDVDFTELFGNVEWTVVGADGARCGEVCDRHHNHGSEIGWGHFLGRGRGHHDDDASGAGSVGDIAVHGAVLPAGASCTFTAEATLTSTASGKVTVTASAQDVGRCAPDAELVTDTDTIIPAGDDGGKDPPSETPGDPKDPPSETPGDPKDPPSETVPTDPKDPASTTAPGGDASAGGDATASNDSDQGGCNATGPSGAWTLAALLVLRQMVRRCRTHT